MSSDVVQAKNILSPSRVLFIDSVSKQDALVSLAKLLASAPQIKRSDELVQEILKREELMSTAIGCGIAIPHVRLASVTDLVMAVGICKNPLTDFNALDNEPVRLLFMIAASHNQHSYYLKTLSYFSAKLRDENLRASIISAKSGEEVCNLLSSD